MIKKILGSIFFLCVLINNIFFYDTIAEQIKYGADKTISRAEATKMICFAYSDKKNIFDLYQTRNINFKDTSPTKWYDKYINAACTRGFVNGVSDDRFEPEKDLTITQAQALLEKISNIKIKITPDNQDKNISYSLWTRLFCDAIKNLDSKIEQKKIIALATHNQNSNIPNNFIVSDQDYFTCEDLSFDFFDKALDVLTKDKEIIAVISYDDEFELKNCEIINQSNNRVYVSCGGLKRFFGYKNKEKIRVGKCDLKIKSGEVIEIKNIT